MTEPASRRDTGARPDPAAPSAPAGLEHDQLAIRTLVEDWVMHRDTANWSAFAALWAADGWMSATWFEGPAAQFVDASRAGFEAGVRIAHSLGGHTCVVAGDRAVAQTKVTIHQRALLHDVPVDVSCSGRFHDFLRRAQGRWTIRRRQPVYERDRLDPVDPTRSPVLDDDDRAVLADYPEGYRWLALVQRRLGEDVAHGLPGPVGPELDHLLREADAWLDGAHSPFLEPHRPGAHRSA